jgi:hypothetical protein
MENWFKNPWGKDGVLSFDWLNNFKENNIESKESSSWTCSSGKIVLKNFSKEQLKGIMIIPEDGLPYFPNKNGEYFGDGFYHKEFSDSKYWYKVSGGSIVTVIRTDTHIRTTPEIGALCKKLAEAAGKYYKVGWEPKESPHNTKNPFDK